METSILKTVGAVAGIGGLAIGFLLIIFRDVIRKNIFPQLNRVQAYRLIRLIVLLAFVTAIAGISAWVYTSVNTTNSKEEEIPPLVDPVEITNSSDDLNNNAAGKNANTTNKSSNTTNKNSNQLSNKTGSNLSLNSNQILFENSHLQGFSTVVPITFSPEEKFNNTSNNLAKTVEQKINPLISQDVVVEQITEGRSSKESERIFDVTLANKSNVRRLLKKFDVRWSYESAGGASQKDAEIIKPIAKYVIPLEIDIVNPNDGRIQPLDPLVVIPPGSEAEPNYLKLRIHIYYKLLHGARHPSTNWDIIFSLSIIDNTYKKIIIFNNKRWKDRRQ